MQILACTNAYATLTFQIGCPVRNREILLIWHRYSFSILIVIFQSHPDIYYIPIKKIFKLIQYTSGFRAVFPNMAWAFLSVIWNLELAVDCAFLTGCTATFVVSDPSSTRCCLFFRWYRSTRRKLPEALS